MHAALHLQAGHKTNPSPTDKTVKPHCLFANATWRHADWVCTKVISKLSSHREGQKLSNCVVKVRPS